MSQPASRSDLFNRRTAAVAVLVLWIAALAWLVDRHYLGERTPVPGSAPRWAVPPGAAFLSVNLAGKQVGLSTLTVDTLVNEYRVTEITTIDLPRLAADTPRRTSTRVEAMYSRMLQLKRFQADLLSEHGRTRLTGSVEDSALVLVAEAPGAPSDTQRIALRRPVILPGAIPLVAASRGLPKPGSRLNLEVFDPIEGELRVEKILVAAESLFIVPDSAEFNEQGKRWEVVHSDTVRAWRLDRANNGIPTQVWVDGAGLPVRMNNPLGAVLDRSAFEMIQTNFRMLPPSSYDSSATTPVYHLSSSNAPVRKRLTALLSLASQPASLPRRIDGMNSGWQTQRGDTVWVAAPDSALVADSTIANDLPYWSHATPDSSVSAWARSILQRQTDTLRQLEFLAAEVRKVIRLVPGEARYLPNRVLKDRAGSLQERVNLLVAMANGVGLHARPVWGLVLIDGSWIQRPWAEIWIGGWMPFDLAVSGHDAGRIRLGTGGSSRFLALVLQAGRVRAQVLEEQR